MTDETSKPGDSFKRRDVIRTACTGVGSTALIGTAAGRRVSTSSSSNVEETLSAAPVQRILSTFSSVQVSKRNLTTVRDTIKRDSFEVTTIPSSLGDITYINQLNGDEEDEAALIELTELRSRAKFAKQDRNVLFTEATLFATPNETYVMRNLTDSELSAVVDDLGYDPDRFDGYKRLDESKIHLVKTPEVSAQHDSNCLTPITSAPESDEVPSLITAYSQDGSENWTANEASVQLSCDIHCASCVAGATVTVAACLSGNPVVCASALISAGLLACEDCPDCYNCV